jgi:hypothetical protein
MTLDYRHVPPDTAGPVRVGHPFDTEIAAERVGWYEVLALVRSLEPDEATEPGYYSDPDWSVADLIAHLGTWLAEAGLQLDRIASGTYEQSDVDIDALNAEFLAAMRDQPWSVVLTQAEASRCRMLQVWYALPRRTAAASWWVAKAGALHYREHLDRLRDWVGVLHERRYETRPMPTREEWEE